MSATTSTSSVPAKVSKVTKSTRSLREKVIAKSAKSVATSKLTQSQPTMASPSPKAASVSDVTELARLTEPHTPATAYSSACSEVSEQPGAVSRKRVSETILRWEGCDISPPKPLTDDETSNASSRTSEPSSRRASILYRTPKKGTGVHMDMATEEANIMLQQGKEALEAVGNMKRECKQRAHESLQGLYETVLSLSDSRARHKYNLEKERSRHAQELVRVERAHTREIEASKKTLALELSRAREEIGETLLATKQIREWLGAETLQAFKENAEIKKGVLALQEAVKKEHEKTRREARTSSGSPGRESPNPVLMRLELNIASITNQLDLLRKQVERLKTDIPAPPATVQEHHCSVPVELIKAASTTERMEAEIQKIAQVLHKYTNTPPPPPPRTSRNT